MFDVKTTQERAIVSRPEFVKLLISGDRFIQVSIETAVREIVCVDAQANRYQGIVTLGGRDMRVETTVQPGEVAEDCLWLLTGVVLDETVEPTDAGLTDAAKVHASLVEQFESLQTELNTVRAQIAQQADNYAKRLMQPFGELFIIEALVGEAIDGHRETLRAAAVQAYEATGVKTFAEGVLGLSVRQQVKRFDAEQALAYCKEKWQDGILPEQVDQKKFEKAARDGFIQPSSEVIAFDNTYNLSVYSSKFPKLAE